MENKSPFSEEYITVRIRTYSDMVLRLALAYLKNIADAQDVCQDVFMKLFQSGKSFIDSDHEKAWIIRVTVNRCKDILRSPWRRRYSAMREADLPIHNSGNREIVACVLALPAKYRVIIHLYYFENYSTAEIAVLLNRKESTVRTQLKRARERLKSEMGGMEDE